jgi:hypothetical protein
MNQSGLTKRIVPITTYTFGNLAASDTSLVVVGQHVDATTFTEADLLVRFHKGTTIGTGTFTVGLIADGWTLNDPSAAFLPPPFSILAPPPGTVQVGSTTSFPFYSAVTPVSWGRFVAVVLVAAQGAAVGALTAVMSVDLALKGGDVAGLPMGPNGYRGYRDI